MSLSKQNNDKNSTTHGFGQADLQYQPPGTVYPEPGVRKDNDSDWVRRDMLWKSTLPRPKYY